MKNFSREIKRQIRQGRKGFNERAMEIIMAKEEKQKHKEMLKV